MKVLVTGFEPFGGETTNPSYEAAAGLPEEIGGHRIVVERLPVSYEKSVQALDGLLERERPDIVICLGQAGGRSAITPEYVAINLQNASIADNDGIVKKEEPVREDGDAAYFATIPVCKIAEALCKMGIPSCVSYSAGAYVCNSVMYHVLYRAQKKYPGLRGGFIHVPFSAQQSASKGGSAASMPLEMITRGILCAVETSLTEGGGEKD